jgi:hypothetical protein
MDYGNRRPTKFCEKRRGFFNKRKSKQCIISLIKPILIRKDTPKEFGFRVRNLPWEKSNYQVECDKTKNEIVIKTINKKYYKRFDIADMKRLGLNLDERALKVKYINNTLIISVLI